MAQMIERRLDVLETTHGIGGRGPRCPECGGFPDREPGPEDIYSLAFVEEDEEMPEDEFCPTCGCQTEFAIYFEDQLE